MAAFIHPNHAELNHRKTEPLYFSPVTKETQIMCTSMGSYLSPYKHIAANYLQREGWQQQKWGEKNPVHSLRQLSVNISVDIHLISSMETLEIPGKIHFLTCRYLVSFHMPQHSPLASSCSCWICRSPVCPISYLPALWEFLGFPQMAIVFLQLNCSMGVFNWNWTLMVSSSV